MNTQNINYTRLSGRRFATGFAILVLVVLTVLVSRQNKKSTPVVEVRKADTNLLELARQLEQTLQQSVNIQAAGTDTNRLLKELQKLHE